MQIPDIWQPAKQFAVMFGAMVGAIMAVSKLNRWMEKRSAKKGKEPEPVSSPLFPNGQKDQIIREIQSLKARMLQSEVAADEFRTETRAFQRDVSERLQAKGI